METRTEKIKRLWKQIHNIRGSYFYWETDSFMKYDYNEKTDSIDCECGVSISIDIPTEEITQKNLTNIINELELRVWDEYKKRNIDLGLMPYC